MWNFAYPYKLKQLIDLVAQRNMLFTYDGNTYGPLLKTPRALLILTRGGAFAETTHEYGPFNSHLFVDCRAISEAAAHPLIGLMFYLRKSASICG